MAAPLPNPLAIGIELCSRISQSGRARQGQALQSQPGDQGDGVVGRQVG